MPKRNSRARLRFLDKRGVFYIVWCEAGRSRERSTGTTSREEAEVALAEFIRERSRNAGPRRPAETLVTDILTDYAKEHAPNTAAPVRISFAIEALAKFWEGRTVAEVTRQTCARYGVTRERSPGTVRRELGVLRAAINHAYGEGRLTQTVAVHLPERPEGRKRWLTRPEAAALLRVALREPRVRLYLPLFVVMAVYTGQRKEALLSLRWSQVDLDGARINFNPPGRRQTKKQRPLAPIAPRLLPHLRRARLRGTDLGFVISRNGERLADIKKGFAAACARAGLEGVSPHSLRHTCATWMMQKGVPLWEASGFLGMSVKTLQDVYGHHHPDYLKHAARAFS